MKFRPVIFLMVMVMMFTTACGKETSSNSSAYEEIQKNLVGLETYESEATVEYKSNNGSNVYDTLQQCNMDGKYKIEVTGPENVAGNVTVTDGEIICQYNPKVSGKVSVSVKEDQERSEILLTSFIKNYLSSQEVSITVGNFGDGSCTVLEAIVPGNHPYLATEKLWVDNESLKPIKLVIYDPDGSERIVVTYKTFEYNKPIDENVFVVPK